MPRSKSLLSRIADLENANAKLQQRISEIETRGIEYCGVFQRAQGYRRGSVCTFENNMFVAIKDTEPGEQPLQHSSWQLCLKGLQDRRSPTAPRRNGAPMMVRP